MFDFGAGPSAPWRGFAEDGRSVADGYRGTDGLTLAENTKCLRHRSFRMNSCCFSSASGAALATSRGMSPSAAPFAAAPMLLLSSPDWHLRMFLEEADRLLSSEPHTHARTRRVVGESLERWSF